MLEVRLIEEATVSFEVVVGIVHRGSLVGLIGDTAVVVVVGMIGQTASLERRAADCVGGSLVVMGFETV